MALAVPFSYSRRIKYCTRYHVALMHWDIAFTFRGARCDVRGMRVPEYLYKYVYCFCTTLESDAVRAVSLFLTNGTPASSNLCRARVYLLFRVHLTYLSYSACLTILHLPNDADLCQKSLILLVRLYFSPEQCVYLQCLNQYALTELIQRQSAATSCIPVLF